jgi:hypothetical protein
VTVRELSFLAPPSRDFCFLFLFSPSEKVFNDCQCTCGRLLLLIGRCMNFSWSSCVNNFAVDIVLCLW